MAFAQAGVRFTAKGVDSFLRIFTNVNRTLDNFNTKVGKAVSSANRLEDQLNRVANVVLIGLIAAITAVSVALSSMVLGGIQVAASFENAFADVTKTVDAFIDRAATAEQGVITLTEAGEDFRRALKDLSYEIPVTFEELSAIAGLGGQLGVVEGLAGDEAKAALLSFSETVAGLGEATNLTQEKAATGLAQISNIFRETVTDIGLNVEQLGSTIVELGNTSAATESLILNFSQRIAGAGQTVGLTQAEVLGIGTAFASIGITAEAGSTAVNRALLIINEAVSNSTDKFLDNTSAIETTIDTISDLQADLVRLEAQTGISGESLTAQRDAWLEAGNAAENFGRQLGDARREQLFKTQTEIDRLTRKLQTLRTTQGQALTTEVFDELLRVVQQTAKGADQTAESFRELFRDDPAEAFALFVEGLAEEGERAGETLDKIGLGSVEATRAFLAMSGASDLVRDRIEAANRAFLENSALTDEVSVRYATLKSNFEEFINVVRGVTEDIFSPLIGPLNKIVDWGKEVVLVIGEEVPRVFEALADKLGPIFDDLFSQFMAPELFAGGEITTPEGFVLSGDLIGVESKSITDLRSAFQSLIDTINEFDATGLHESAIYWRDTIVPIWTGATDWARENTEFLTGAVKGLATVLGGIVLASAITKAASLIGFLATPVGILSSLVFGLTIAWETNFANIQRVVETTTTNIKTSLSTFASGIEALDLGSMFRDLFGGEQMITPEGFVISGELIGIEPETNALLEGLGRAAEFAAEKIGQLFSLFVQSVLDRISGVLNIFVGLRDIFREITSDTGTVEGVLRGLFDTIGGFFELITAPVFNIAEFFGIDLTVVKEFGAMGAEDFIVGFIEGFTGTEITDLSTAFNDLWANITTLGESEEMQNFFLGIQGLWQAIQDLGPILVEFKDTIKEVVGLEPDDSLFVLFGWIAGLAASSVVEGLTATVTALSGLVTAIDALITLDHEKGAKGIERINEALNIFLTGEEEVDPGIFQNVLDAIALLEGLADQIRTIDELMGESPLVRIGRVISSGLENFSTTIGQASGLMVQAIKDAFAVDLDVTALDQQLTEWTDKISVALYRAIVPESLRKITFTDIFDTPAILQDLLIAGQQIQGFFEGLLDDVSFGIPSFTELLKKVFEIGSKIRTFFTELFTIDFDFGILDKLAELGIIDLEVEAPDTEGMGTDLSQPIIDEVEAEEENWAETWLNFLLSPIETSKEILGIESPSTVTQQIGSDLVEGLALGLSNLTPVIEALDPLLMTLRNAFDVLHLETIPRVTSSLMDGLIPAKMDLAEVNISELIPSVDALIEVEDLLREAFDRVRESLEKLIDKHKDAKDRIKDQTKEVDKLKKAYEQLADAIDKIDTVSPPEPSAPGGPEFQSGGSFVVPSSVGPEGMPIRVHANELVQIIPAEFRRKIQSIPLDVVPTSVKSPSVGGMIINNVANDSSTSSDIKEYHLHVQEAPTSDVRDSFSLLEALI